MLLQTLALWPAAAIPIVPAPNTMAFSPLRVKECRAARQPIVSGSIRQAALEEMVSGTS